MNRRIVMSSLSIFASAALVAGATFAFFSDTETSAGNVLAAGAIDLKIDNTSYLNGVKQTGENSTTWTLRDITDELFFNFTDLKPGDEGEDTISLHVDSNDAWLCMDFEVTKDDDVSSTEPELEDLDDAENANDMFDGELGDALKFVFWADDGDNVLEDNEDEEKIIAQGSASTVLDATHILADSTGNKLQGGNGAVTGGTDHFVGKAWCYGTLVLSPQEQDNPANVGPDLREGGAGVDCNGVALDDTTQTDKLEATLAFRAVQARNNDNFLCATPL